MIETTFEVVYANAYVRESVNVLMANLMKQYPAMRPDEDDIRQQLLLILDRQIPRFNPAKSSLERFARITLEFGVREVRRAYFGKKTLARNKVVRLAEPISDDFSCDEHDDSVERRELTGAIREAMKELTPVQRLICELLADGEPLWIVCQKAGMRYSTLKDRQLPEIRRVLKKYLF